MSSLVFAGIFNLPFLFRAIDIGTSSSTTSPPLGSPDNLSLIRFTNRVYSKESSANAELKTIQSSSHLKRVAIEAMHQYLLN